jgi:hypothetical protein
VIAAGPGEGSRLTIAIDLLGRSLSFKLGIHEVEPVT